MIEFNARGGTSRGPPELLNLVAKDVRVHRGRTPESRAHPCSYVHAKLNKPINLIKIPVKKKGLNACCGSKF